MSRVGEKVKRSDLTYEQCRQRLMRTPSDLGHHGPFYCSNVRLRSDGSQRRDGFFVMNEPHLSNNGKWTVYARRVPIRELLIAPIQHVPHEQMVKMERVWK